MADHELLPPAMDAEALLALSRGHHDRTARAWGTREAGGHLVKVYSVQAPGRAVTEQDVATAPCVWEAAVLAHEREAFSRHLLDGDGSLADRLAAWQADTLEGGVR